MRKASLKPSYDVIVIGGDLAGLVTASFLSKEGANVLVTNPEAQARSVTLGPYRFEEPFSLIANATSHGAFGHLEGKLGVKLEWLLWDQPPQLINEPRRYQWGGFPEVIEHDLEREYPRSFSSLLEWHRNLKEVGPPLDPIFEHMLKGERPTPRWLKEQKISPRKLRRSTMYRLKDEEAFSHITLLHGALTALTYTLPTKTDGLTLAFWQHRLQHAVGTIVGGIDHVRTQLMENLKESKAKISSTSVTPIRVHKEKIEGIELTDGRITKAGVVIFNEGFHSTYRRIKLLSKKSFSSPTKNRPMAFWRHYLFSVRAEAIPDYFSHTLISLEDPKQPFANYNLMALSLSHPEDTTQAPKGERILTASFLLDPANPQIKEPNIVERITSLLPFFKKYLSGAHTVTLPFSIPRRPLVRPAILGNPLRDWKLPLKNGFYCGPELFAEFGVEGEILCGFRLARLIQEKSHV